MKYLDVMEQGGYPFDDISIDYLQKMHDDRDSFIHSVFGDFKIVKGVTLNTQSNTYSDGLITANGKLYHFVGGAPHNRISKKTIETKRQYEDGNDKKAFINEFYEFGEDGTDVIVFSGMKRWYENQPITKEIKYVGATVTNESLPDGWFIADGTNGTDDLRSQFIVGFDSRDVDYNSVGKTGGEKKHKLTIDEMPIHSHKVTVETMNGTGANADGDENSGTETIDTQNSGGDQPHENRPPYYVMIIIQFVGL
jgi:hypothetical protein